MKNIESTLKVPVDCGGAREQCDSSPAIWIYDEKLFIMTLFEKCEPRWGCAREPVNECQILLTSFLARPRDLLHFNFIETHFSSFFLAVLSDFPLAARQWRELGSLIFGKLSVKLLFVFDLRLLEQLTSRLCLLLYTVFARFDDRSHVGL